MKKIIVAGAGHGGITAALKLSKAGYAVTVYEKCAREALGYDWSDCVRKCSFENAGFPRPDESCFEPIEDRGFFSPKKSVKISVAKDIGNRTGYIDRKFLIKALIDFAEKNGVKFVFNARVICAICDSERVKGFKIEENGVRKDIFGDMIIDAAGIDSPVRRTLPEELGVRNEAYPEEIFYTWRGYFKKTEDFSVEPNYTVYFYHCGHKGLDWAVNEEDYVDILIGGFGSLTEDDIKKSLDDFKSEYPIEDIPFRGGYGDKIPLGRFLEVMVCNNYAAVGNSAFMTEPLSGSGIDMSMNCGKILADTIIQSGGDFSVEKLWKYNYRAFKEEEEKNYNKIVIKSFLSVLEPDDVDFFFEHKILTAKEIGETTNVTYTFKELIQKAEVLSKAHLLPGFANVLKKLTELNKLKAAIPEGNNEAAVENWRKEYSKLR